MFSSRCMRNCCIIGVFVGSANAIIAAAPASESCPDGCIESKSSSSVALALREDDSDNNTSTNVNAKKYLECAVGMKVSIIDFRLKGILDIQAIALYDDVYDSDAGVLKPDVETTHFQSDREVAEDVRARLVYKIHSSHAGVESIWLPRDQFEPWEAYQTMSNKIRPRFPFDTLPGDQVKSDLLSFMADGGDIYFEYIRLNSRLNITTSVLRKTLSVTFHTAIPTHRLFDEVIINLPDFNVNHVRGVSLKHSVFYELMDSFYEYATGNATGEDFMNQENRFKNN